MPLLPQDVGQLARMGANIELTGATAYVPQAIEEWIRLAVEHGGHITITAGGYLPQTLEQFVRIGGNKVTIRI